MTLLLHGCHYQSLTKRYKDGCRIKKMSWMWWRIKINRTIGKHPTVERSKQWERLTKKVKNSSIHSHEPTENGNDLDRTDLLGEYEDTGLSPKNIILRENDIKFLQRQNKEYREVILSLQKQLREETNHEKN